MVYSFDIFDTCLVRTCGKPQNLIYALAHAVLGDNAEFVYIRDFARKRRQAEIDLYQDGVEAPPIEQIYQRLDFSFYTSLTNDQILAKEMELEKKALVPVADMVKKVEECRRKGRVVFISDMYFPSSFLRPILEKYGLIKDGESLYISCEHQASKATGNLFEVVRKAEHISYHQWVHFGDDYHNDYKIPKKKGIKTVKIHHDNLEYEDLCERLSPYSKDKISASFFSGILRATRLSLGINNDGGFLTGVMCSMLVPFVVSCMKDAQKRHIKRLYFASRDAYVMFLIAKRFISLFPDLELKYLYISTKTILPLMIKDATFEEVQHVLSRNYYYRPKSILEMFGYNAQQINEIGKQIDIESNTLVSENRTEQFIKLLVEGENKRVLKANVCQKKNLILSYFHQEGFNGDVMNIEVGLVDCGWSGTCQKILVDSIGWKVWHYYLGVLPNKYFDNMKNYSAYFYPEIVDTDHPKFIEGYICRNLEGTVMGYECGKDGRINVIHAKRKTTLSEIEDFELRTKILESASEMFKKYKLLMNASEDIFNSCSSLILHNVMKYPSKSIASFLSDKTVWDAFIEEQPLITKLYPHQYVIQKIFQRGDADRVKRYVYQWRVACLSYTYGRWILYVLYAIKNIRKRFR